MKKFFYRVKCEDSVIGISRKFGVPAQKIIKTNNLKREVEEGDLLEIECVERTHVVRLKETVESIAKKYAVAESELKRKHGAEYFYYGQLIEI